MSAGSDSAIFVYDQRKPTEVLHLLMHETNAIARRQRNKIVQVQHQLSATNAKPHSFRVVNGLPADSSCLAALMALCGSGTFVAETLLLMSFERTRQQLQALRYLSARISSSAVTHSPRIKECSLICLQGGDEAHGKGHDIRLYSMPQKHRKACYRLQHKTTKRRAKEIEASLLQPANASALADEPELPQE